MFRRLINISKRHLENNYIIYFLLSLFMLAGIIFGSIFILKTNENFNLMPYFNYIFKYINNENYAYIDISKSSLVFNMKGLLIIWALGFLNFGIIITPLIICFKGISIGFTVGYFVKNFGIKGFLFSVLGFLPSYLVLVPMFLIMCAVSILKSISYAKLKSRNFGSVNLSDYGIILLLFFLITLLVILLEGFLISTLFKITGI